MKYLIDSNTFVAPHRGYAPPIDVATSLWCKIKSLADEGIIFSIDKVKDELYSNDDELKQWLSTKVNTNFFINSTTDNSIRKLSEILQWADANTTYSDKAKSKFMKMDKTDVFLAAFASAHPAEWTIVSFETTNHFGSSEIKLPDVCTYFGAKCIPLQSMFRELNMTY